MERNPRGGKIERKEKFGVKVIVAFRYFTRKNGEL